MTQYEKMGGTYTKQRDYYLPNLVLPTEEETEIGVWGQRHLRYIKQHRKVFYINLLTSCKLTSHLSNLDKRAERMFEDIVKSLAENEGVTEKLKAAAPMEWVQKMNNIRNRATEIVNAEVVYA